MPLYNSKILNDFDIKNNDFGNLNPNNHIIGKNITLQLTTLQSPVITFSSNATLRFTDEQDVRPILGDDSEGSEG